MSAKCYTTETQQEEKDHILADSIILLKDEPIYDVVNKLPSFPSGDKALKAYLASHTKYQLVGEEGFRNAFLCTFIVEKDGTLTDIKVVNGVDSILDTEAIREIKKMPKWNPGMQNGVFVRVKHFLPLHYPPKSKSDDKSGI